MAIVLPKFPRRGVSKHLQTADQLKARHCDSSLGDFNPATSLAKRWSLNIGLVDGQRKVWPRWKPPSFGIPKGKGPEDLGVHFFQRLSGRVTRSTRLAITTAHPIYIALVSAQLRRPAGQDPLERSGASLPVGRYRVGLSTTVLLGFPHSRSLGESNFTPGVSGIRLHAMTEHDNPFSSRYIRPGAIPYYPCDGRTPAALADQFLQQASPMAAIVGPHGSGKSTLLHAMIPFLGPVVETHNIPASEFERNGVATGEGLVLPQSISLEGRLVSLGTPQVAMNPRPTPIATANRFFASLRFGLGRNQQVTNALLEKTRDRVAKQILIVDGYEQLSGWQAWWLRRRIRASASRLLVTSHQRIASIPTLITTKIVPDSKAMF